MSDLEDPNANHVQIRIEGPLADLDTYWNELTAKPVPIELDTSQGFERFERIHALAQRIGVDATKDGKVREDDLGTRYQYFLRIAVTNPNLFETIEQAEKDNQSSFGFEVQNVERGITKIIKFRRYDQFDKDYNPSSDFVFSRSLPWTYAGKLPADLQNKTYPALVQPEFYFSETRRELTFNLRTLLIEMGKLKPDQNIINFSWDFTVMFD
jgi:hypothetical protein